MGRYVTLTLSDEGTLKRHTFRVKRWLLIGSITVASAAIIISLVLLISMAPLISRAVEADQLRDENKQLLEMQKNYALLEQNLSEMRQFVARLAAIAGVDYVYAPDTLGGVPRQSTGLATLLRPGENIDYPAGLPVEGFISRGYLDDHGGTDDYHPGIDLACPEGTPVLATASGTVEEAKFDDVYGYVVKIKHSDSVMTIYAHNKEILVDPGQHVDVGSRIALSGNTGRSTAPHVHYEIRIHGKPINPVEGENHDQETVW